MESQRPGKFPKKVSWNVTTLKGGGTLRGWVAGPMFGCHGHVMPPFKPCYYELTKDQLKCPYHELRGEPDWQGYWPIYSDAGKPMAVIIYEYHLDLVLNFKLHDSVLITRGEGKYDPMVIGPGKVPYYRATLPERQRQVDLRQWLVFTLFKSESQLVNYFTSNPIKNPLSQMEKAGPVKADVRPAEPGYDLKREVLKKTLEVNGHHESANRLPATLDAAMEEQKQRLMEKAKRFERNGKGG